MFQLIQVFYFYLQGVVQAILLSALLFMNILSSAEKSFILKLMVAK